MLVSRTSNPHSLPTYRPHSTSRSTMDPKRIFSSFKTKFSRNSAMPAQFGTHDESLSRSNLDGLSTAKNNPFVPEAPAAQQPQNSFLDTPPAYTRNPEPNDRSRSRVSPSPSRASISSVEDRYAFLSTFDTIFVIDDSASMSLPTRHEGHGRPNSRWVEVKNALAAILPICTSHDPDGIDLYFLNHKSKNQGSKFQAKGGYHNIYRQDQVDELFARLRPRNGTPTGICLSRILEPYMRKLDANKDNIEDVKPINIIVITDGHPTDEPDTIIRGIAGRLEKLEAPPHQVGIQFFQVGDDPAAAEALRYLDDELCKKNDENEYTRDIVDTVAWKSFKPGESNGLSADGILKVVLGAVMRKLDAKTLD